MWTFCGTLGDKPILIWFNNDYHMERTKLALYGIEDRQSLNQLSCAVLNSPYEERLRDQAIQRQTIFLMQRIRCSQGTYMWPSSALGATVATDSMETSRNITLSVPSSKYWQSLFSSKTGEGRMHKPLAGVIVARATPAGATCGFVVSLLASQSFTFFPPGSSP